MVINRQHAQSIVNEMKCSIHHDINIMDQQGIIIASTNPVRCGQLHQGALELIEQHLPCQIVRSDDPSRGVQAGINLPILMDGELAGVIGITGDPDEVSIFGDIIRRMTELMLESIRQKEDWELLDRAKGLFLETWFFADQPDWPQLEVRGRLLGLDITEPYTVAVLQLTHPSEPAPESQPGEIQSGLILRMIQRHIQADSRHFCAAVRNKIIILLHLCGRKDSFALVHRICQDIEGYYGVRVSGGISSISQSPVDIRRCYREASTASSVAAETPRSCLLFYDKVSLEFIVRSIPKPILRDLRQMVFASCTPEEQEDLSQLILLYFDCGGSIQRGAEVLYVHRNTFQYRLDHLKKKTGYDLKKPKEALLLYLAAYQEPAS